jgi:hypothetical protein
VNAAATPGRRMPPRRVAVIAALLLALEATDVAARYRARLRHAVQMWWLGFERRERGTLRVRVLRRLIPGG